MKKNNIRLKQLTIKYITAALIFFVTIFFTPNFNFSAFPILLLFSFFIVFLDYIVATFTGIHDLPLPRSIVSFVSCAIILYMTQFFVSGYFISLLSTIVAALIYAVIDYYLPNKE
ncbi:MAG: phage holin family protein [Clostridia bacterium]|nr:phage holin family protein [Clostridia bacterium]